jgi:hypothetical protein
MPTIEDEKLARKLWGDLKAQAKAVAELRGPAPKTKKTTSADEALLLLEEAKGWTPEKEMALLAEGKTPTQVGYEKYPHRQKLAERGDRALSKYAQAKWLADAIRKIDPSWTPPPRPDALPEPLAALDAESPED